MSEESTAVAKRDSVSIGDRSRSQFDPGQMQLIKQTVAKDCSDAELGMFLELCARYQLDPFQREIFAAKMGGRDGAGGRVAIIVGRDGLLKIAQRHDDFQGLEGDVVREHDRFSKSAGDSLPEHHYEGHALKDGEDGGRGKIVGAWATVFRHGRRPTYFYAPVHEYKPTGNRLTYSPWSSQESAMILKCAESMALRKAFSITGLVAEEEMGRTLEREAEDAGMTDWGEEPTMAAWLPRLFDAANAEKPDAYRPAKIRMMLRGRDEGQRERIAADLVEYLVAVGAKVPKRPTLDQLGEDEEVVSEADTELLGAGDVEFPGPDDPDVVRAREAILEDEGTATIGIDAEGEGEVRDGDEG